VHGDGANLIVGDVDDDLPLQHVRIGDELLDVVDRRGRHLSCLKDGKALRAIVPGNELANRPLGLGIVGKARAVVGISRNPFG
jgi:hypothetical protein